MSFVDYPTTPRAHRLSPPAGPYPSYKEWLRVDFDFTCVYCGADERPTGGLAFEIDHFWPKGIADFDHLVDLYLNLYWACRACNGEKRTKLLPLEPRLDAYGDHLQVAPDGAITSLTEAGQHLIEELSLDSARHQRNRSLRRRLFEGLRARQDDEGRRLFHDLFVGEPEPRPPDDIPRVTRSNPASGYRVAAS